MGLGHTINNKIPICPIFYLLKLIHGLDPTLREVVLADTFKGFFAQLQQPVAKLGPIRLV